MSTPSNDEFYVNYSKMPASYRWFLFKVIPLLVIGVVAFAWLLPGIHNQFNTGKFQAQSFDGFLVGEPIPHIIVPRPGNTQAGPAFSRYFLSATNKAGPPQRILDQAGQWVTLKGILVSRSNLSMVAVQSAEPIDPPAGVAEVKPDEGNALGSYTLEGEILDGKCYPGIMKPGHTKTHRACAIRCISCGGPLVFRVLFDGDVMYFLLADSAGQAVNDRVLDWVADSIRITGEVAQYGDMYVLQADPESYERLG